MRVARIARLLLHVARGLLIARFRFPKWTREERQHAIARWSREVLDILAIRLHVHGASAQTDGPLMLVANHVSWLDIFVINAIVPVRFVAKSEIRDWPLLGWLCEQAGTVFIRQARRHDTMRVNAAMAAAMASGDVFVVFPEGTTSNGAAVAKFHSSLLDPALKARARVQPLAIRYDRIDSTRCIEVSYAGERSLWDTVKDIAAEPQIHAHLAFLEPISSDAAHRRTLTDRAREAIRLTLYPETLDTRTGTIVDRRA